MYIKCRSNERQIYSASAPGTRSLHTGDATGLLDIAVRKHPEQLLFRKLLFDALLFDHEINYVARA
jgi:hypothetical protein